MSSVPSTGPADEPFDPVDVDGRSSSLGARGVLLSASAFCAVLLAGLFGVVHVPYVALSPGPVTDVIAGDRDGKGLITISGHETYPTDGQLDLTTVSLRGGPGLEMTLGELLLDWVDPAVNVVPRSLYFPDSQTQQEADDESAAEMTSSQTNAKVAALTELGIEVPATTTTQVEQVAADAPAARVLRPADTITAVDGEPVTTFAALQAAVRALPGGARVTLGVTRGGKATTVTTTTVSANGTTLLGITPHVDYEFPFDIDVAIDDVGGPSAGTMFALGIVDELTPGAMTGGQHVAGTGAIDADGTVEQIGGLRQKVLGAQADGARWFLAPRAECDQVAGATPDGITVVPITTLHDARQAVEAIGRGEGGTLETCDAAAASSD
ncbi:YlbL family protein [Kineococcus rhizosphaerae]|uniref:PDZ domain-containing protein n=1 Tax=Kineococcus rhizosphaerae TaxID=559628 RepID=A0A2T0R435_9ACTN|nr:PDZ domain-containing protein [Kineococcus rhizosphaerae]PRY15113.1 PDZ domain-containing protein [Kineococcus rhizosphaerae]